jgi:hypothetical protein
VIVSSSAVLVAALVLRAVYTWGSKKALENPTSEPNRSMTT